jgi:hypothetical protein
MMIARHNDRAMTGKGSGSTDTTVPTSAVSANRNGCYRLVW